MHVDAFEYPYKAGFFACCLSLRREEHGRDGLLEARFTDRLFAWVPTLTMSSD